MENNDKKSSMESTRNVLLAEFVAMVTIAVLAVVLYESGVLAMGAWAHCSGAEFVLTVILELATLAVIPLALRLFKFKKVKKQIAAGKDKALRKWGTLRICLLGVPLMLNAWLYYSFSSTKFGYMAIILLLCMPFVFPSVGKCNYEVSMAQRNGEN